MNRAHAYFALPLAALIALVALLVWGWIRLRRICIWGTAWCWRS